MSAYNASAPVTASTTEPRMKMPCQPWFMKNSTPYHGFTALRIDGSFAISSPPKSAMLPNHSSITGPNTRPIFVVPPRWNRKRMKSTTTLIGTTRCRSAGVATSMPSTAPSTDTAGVMTPSP